MEVSGKLCLKVDDEQLDELVINHCQRAIDVCTSVIELELATLENKSRADEQQQISSALMIVDYEEYLNALRTVIKFFGGEPIDTSVNVFTKTKMESANETTDRSS
jgi:hypothetical protein